ncbi:ABC transporter [Desulfuromonas versatilis]|uniref:ABC transporter n=1 Tax=Desulfuromonas versatilis TaxID=2802975 RepID=A0ABM8HWX9_9BACT|nr:ATP-binding cassette domain-containing protein [Desulfuromonas versatilis]BCR06450.1 ABC transporter [Desulfuromonas versatilis]
MPTVIEAENLRKSFGEFAAVDGISFQVRRGECFGLLGPNGAGKTSTIRMLYGYSPLSGGGLKVFGRDLAGHLREAKQRIGVCQQEDNLDPDLPVLENLLVFARYFDIPRARAEAEAWSLLKFFALDGRAKSSIQELSGGMKRRLVLARSLINRPELLILDEPTTGLDPQSRHQVWQRLEELKERGLTILLTSHYLEEASRLCDRLIIMDRGKILVQGQPAELVRRYVGREVIEVVAPSAELRGYLQGQPVEFEDLGRRLLVYNLPGDELFIHLTRDFRQDGCTLRLANLEDVFLRLTGRELRE